MIKSTAWLRFALFVMFFTMLRTAFSQGCANINNNNVGNGGTHATICFFNSHGTSMGPCLDCQLTGAGWKCGSAFNAYSSYYSATISGLPCTNAVSLPVELTNFYAVSETNGVRVSWETASERTSDYFELTRLNKNLEIIHSVKIPAAGNSNMQLAYTYLDTDVEDGINYYLLKQFDLDGQSRTFEMISVDAGTRIFTLYPNPLRSGTIYWKNETGADRIDIYAADGKQLGNTQASIGFYTFEGALQSMYIFKVTYIDHSEKYFRIITE